MNRVLLAIALTSAMAGSSPAAASGGVYLPKDGGTVSSSTSHVAIVRNGTRTTLTMSSNFETGVKQIALIIPVPATFRTDAVRVMDGYALWSLDWRTEPAFSIEPDDEPCRFDPEMSEDGTTMTISARRPTIDRIVCSGGTVVDEKRDRFDFSILPGDPSKQERWLTRNGYGISRQALDVLRAYELQGMKLLAVEVELKQKHRGGPGNDFLAPIQLTFDSPTFALPILLGALNATGPQDLYVYAISPVGRVEPTYLPTVKFPVGRNFPAEARHDTEELSRRIVDHHLANRGASVVFTEHVRDVGGCEEDNCVFAPEELADLGVDWPGSAYLTRLHLRHQGSGFSQDLVLHANAQDTDPFAARSTIKVPFDRHTDCGKYGEAYRAMLSARQAAAIQTLLELTGSATPPSRVPRLVEREADEDVEPADVGDEEFPELEP